MAQLRFRQVGYFVEIVDAGSMTSAARRLNLVPTALSLQIRKLEDEFGVKLLERHARGVSPTDTGLRFYRSARKILDTLDESEAIISGRSDVKQHFSFGMTPSFLHAVGVGALMPEPDAANGIMIEVVEANAADLMARLDVGELDFVIGAIAPFAQRSDASVFEVAEEPLVYVTSAEHHLDDGPIELEEALGPNLISIGSQSQSWSALQILAERTGRGVEAAHTVRSSELLRQMLLQDLGAAILPVSFVAPELRNGTLRARKLKGEPLKRRLGFACSGASRRRHDDQRILRYVRYLVEEFTLGTAPHSRELGVLWSGRNSTKP